MIFVHQEQATDISDCVKSTDSSSSNDESDVDNISVPKGELVNVTDEVGNHASKQPRIYFEKNNDQYTDEDLTDLRFSQEELLSLNHDNFKRLFQLRGVPHFPCNKAPAELVNILFAHADSLSKFDDNDDKYTDKELKER